jgi:hypothetical protein
VFVDLGMIADNESGKEEVVLRTKGRDELSQQCFIACWFVRRPRIQIYSRDLSHETKNIKSGSRHWTFRTLNKQNQRNRSACVRGP